MQKGGTLNGIWIDFCRLIYTYRLHRSLRYRGKGKEDEKIKRSGRYNICNGVFTSLGDSRTPLYFLIGSSLGNIFLDLIFLPGL